MAYDKINFSRTSLAGLPAAPAGKRAYYSDTKEPGLLLCVTGTGAKSFQVYMKLDGRPVRVTLGRFNSSLADSIELPRDCAYSDFLANNPELNVRMARSLAALVKIDLKAGIRPADVKRAKRAEPTLGELLEEYINRHMIPRKLKTIEDVRCDFERYIGELPPTPRKKHGKVRAKPPGSVNWSKRAISNIPKGEIQRLHADLGRLTGHTTANKIVSILKAMYNQAINWGLFDKTNPVTGIKKFPTRSRERFLQSNELPRFFESVAAEPELDIRDYVLLSLLTGARRSNVISMRWADVDLDRALWIVPHTMSKNGDSMSVPLMPEAVEILRNRKPADPAEYVFPGGSKSGHREDPRRGWERIINRDEITQLAKRINDAGGSFEWPILREKTKGDKGRKYESVDASLARARKMAAAMKIDTTGTRLTDLRIHDMRRTLGSWQAATGASLVVIGKSLGHKNMASTQVYSRLDLDPVRDSMQTATRSMFSAGGLLPTAEVIPLKKMA